MKFDFDLSSIGSLLSIVIVTIAAFSIVSVAVYQLQVQRRIQNQASIVSNEGLELSRSTIDWGNLEPGETKTENVTATNTWNTQVNLDINVTNWQPREAEKFIQVTWNYQAETLSANQQYRISFELTVDPDISGIEQFSFDIYVTSTERA